MNDDQFHPTCGARNDARDDVCVGLAFNELAAELEHDPAPHSSPAVSSTPHITLKFCTADPAAPFTRLSITETTTARPVAGSTFQPMSQKFDHATCLISGRSVP